MKKTLVLSFITAFAAGGLQAKEFKVDADHSTVGFAVKHLGLTNVKGLFKNFDGELKLDDKSGKPATIVGSVETKSIDTRNEKRDEHLRAPDFFETSKKENAKISFKMKKFEGDKANGKLTGDLTIKGKTKEVTLDAKVSEIVQDPWGNDRVAISAKGIINRQDFGVKFDKTFGKAGELVVANNVDLELDIEAMAPGKKTPDKKK